MTGCCVVSLLSNSTSSQLCAALWHAGYPYSYPTSSRSVNLICEGAPPSSTSLEDISLLACSLDRDAPALSQPVTGDPRFQNAFMLSIFHSILNLPGWRVGYTEGQMEGVLALPLLSPSPAIQRMLLVALVNISSSDTGRNTVTEPSQLVRPMITFYYIICIAGLSLEFDISHSTLRPFDSSSPQAVFAPTGEAVVVTQTLARDGMLSRVDIMNRPRGYSGYLPDSTADMIAYCRNKWGLDLSTSNLLDMVQVCFVDRLSPVEEVIPVQILAR